MQTLPNFQVAARKRVVGEGMDMIVKCALEEEFVKLAVGTTWLLKKSQVKNSQSNSDCNQLEAVTSGHIDSYGFSSSQNTIAGWGDSSIHAVYHQWGGIHGFLSFSPEGRMRENYNE